jgi:hypothetical protein
VGRFYFHLSAGEQVIIDPEGSDLPDVSSAEQEAMEGAREILANAIRDGREDIPEVFVIADESGRLLATVPLLAALPKALRR